MSFTPNFASSSLPPSCPGNVPPCRLHFVLSRQSTLNYSRIHLQHFFFVHRLELFLTVLLFYDSNPSFPSRFVIGRSRGEAMADRRKDELNGYVWHLIHAAPEVAQVGLSTPTVPNSLRHGAKNGPQSGPHWVSCWKAVSARACFPGRITFLCFWGACVCVRELCRDCSLTSQKGSAKKKGNLFSGLCFTHLVEFAALQSTIENTNSNWKRN